MKLLQHQYYSSDLMMPVCIIIEVLSLTPGGITHSYIVLLEFLRQIIYLIDGTEY